MEITEKITKDVWKEIIKLQYQKGSIEDIGLYKRNELNEKDLSTIIQKLKSLELLEYINNSEETNIYYVAIPDKFRDSIFQKGIYINENNLDGDTLKEFLNESINQLNKLILRTKPLGIETPPPLSIYLIRTRQKFGSLLNNLERKINIHSLGVEKSINPDNDTTKITYTYEKEDKKKARFLVFISNIFLKTQELEGIDLKQIESHITNIIEDFICENNLNLGYSTYKLKYICSTNNIPEDCIQISDIEDLKKYKMKDLVLEKYI
ncbi:MAG: hypothetical protein KBH94_06525 [Caldisericia bacterium]|nr:hypothetical protein [Caldisericia bacterium]